ncbi:MAG: sigma 54-interacting transcriptional regulator [Proteobacteria bacterium]|nr:sigma 54-interacting transcriptional regulator [Pseudomonadota bacterium]
MELKTKDEQPVLNKTASSNYTEIILESISDGVFTVDSEWRITSFNRAAEEITKIPREEAIGRFCFDVFRANMCETNCALRKTMETGKSIINRAAFIVDINGHRIPISISTGLLKDEKGDVIGGVESFRDLTLVEKLRKEIEGRFQVGDLVSRSDLMKKIFDVLPQLSASDSRILIQGETGTGKELLARAIHNMSTRSVKPFIAINCGALPDTLLESELFGYKKGAFTGANQDKPGRFELADKGTLFLDEIGEISQAMQVRLLRVLQENAYEPLGGTKPLKTNVRVIAATNKDLAELVKEGKFRQDLFFRINVVRIDLPPLHMRREDIPLLVDHFISKFNDLQNKSITSVSPEVLSFLMSHDYPGNIRELENIIEHAFVLLSEGMIEPQHLPKDLIAHIPQSKIQGNINTAVRMIEIQTIHDALKRNNFNRLKTSKELGIHKSTLFRKLKRLGITLPPKNSKKN